MGRSRTSATAVFLIAFTMTCIPTWTTPKLKPISTPDTAYVCTTNIPEKHLDEVKAAVEAWDKAIGGWRHIIVNDVPDTACTYIVSEVASDDPTMEETHKDAAAWVSMIGGSHVYMRKGHYEHDVAGLVMHEIGHLLGAQHVPYTLMHQTWERLMFVCPDATTVAQVAAWNQVDIRLFSWCAP